MAHKPTPACYAKGELRDQTPPSTGRRTQRSCECLKPCAKIYLDLTSIGTKTYREKWKSDTAFVGCQDVENFLVALGLIRYSVEESFISSKKDQEGEDDSDNVWEGVASDQENNLDFHHFLERDAPDLKAYKKTTLKRHGIKPQEKESIGCRACYYYLEIFIDRFRAMLRAKCTRSERYERLFAKLTPKQRLVVEEYIIGPLGKKPMTDAAKKLGMNFHTFRDHLEAAKKKIRRVYPEKRLRKAVNAYRRDLFYDFWRQSEHDKVGVVRYVNHVTGIQREFDLKEENPFKKKPDGTPRLCLNWLKNQIDEREYLIPRHTLESWNQEENKRNRRPIDDLFDGVAETRKL